TLATATSGCLSFQAEDGIRDRNVTGVQTCLFRSLVTASTPGADMTPGKMDYTSRPLDVALQQDGWLVVQTADGSEGYTRNGSIQVDPTGQLTIQGHPVIGEAGPIAVPEGAEIPIAADGTISALNPGDPAK